MIYLDYAASTPLDPRARTAMDDAAALVGNPSSVHSFGREVRAALDRARASVGRLFNAQTSQVVFTSGATEANALATLGLYRAVKRRYSGRSLRVLISAVEHASVAEMAALLGRDDGAVIDVLPLGRDGVVDLSSFDASVTSDTVLVCVMWANNVTGTLQPIEEIGRRVNAIRAMRGAGGLPLYFVCDAVQAASTQDVRLQPGMSALSISGHKMYGPKGVGALVLALGVMPEPLVSGGGQENGLRHGTENVAGIVGFGASAEFLTTEREADVARAAVFRSRLLSALPTHVRAIGAGAVAVPGILYLHRRGMSGAELAIRLDAAGVAVSAGSACDSGKRKKPAWLSALRDRELERDGGVRVSFGRFTSEDDIDTAVAALMSNRRT